MLLKGKDRRMILQSKRVWILNDWQEAQIEISEKTGKIEGIYPYGTRKAAMDFDSLRMVPGFIDVHAHGGYGFDTNDAEEEGLKNWMARENEMICCCSDGTRPVIFKIERIDYEDLFPADLNQKTISQ